MRIVRTKIEFMTALQKELEALQVADRNEILSDFTLHFSDSAKLGLSEAEICGKLGDITEIAKQYAGDDEYATVTSKAVTKEQASVDNSYTNDTGINTQNKNIGLKTKTNTDNIELIFPDPTATFEHKDKVKENPLVLNDFGDAKEIEELIKAAPVYPDAKDKVLLHENEEKQQTAQTTQNVQTNQTAQTVQNNAGMQNNNVQNFIQTGINNGWNAYKNNSTNINISNLIAVLCVDLFVFSWAIPAFISVVVALASVPVSLIGAGLGMVIDGLVKGVNITSIFNFLNINTNLFGSLSTILLGIFITCVGGLFILIEVKLVKLCIKAIKGIINWHGKMIVGKPVFKDKNAFAKV